MWHIALMASSTECDIAAVVPVTRVCPRYEIAAENKRLSEPLARALKEMEVLRSALASADKDKASLAQSKARLAAAEKQVRRGLLRTASGVATQQLACPLADLVCELLLLPCGLIHAAHAARDVDLSLAVTVVLSMGWCCAGEEPGVGG
jgi:hypothetical protein